MLESKGITLFECTEPQESGAALLKMEGSFAVSPTWPSVQSFFGNYGKVFPVTLDGKAFARIEQLEKCSDTRHKWRVEMDLPFPLSKRDLVFFCDTRTTPDGSLVCASSSLR